MAILNRMIITYYHNYDLYGPRAILLKSHMNYGHTGQVIGLEKPVGPYYKRAVINMAMLSQKIQIHSGH